MDELFSRYSFEFKGTTLVIEQVSASGFGASIGGNTIGSFSSAGDGRIGLMKNIFPEMPTSETRPGFLPPLSVWKTETFDPYMPGDC